MGMLQAFPSITSKGRCIQQVLSLFADPPGQVEVRVGAAVVQSDGPCDVLSLSCCTWLIALIVGCDVSFRLSCACQEHGHDIYVVVRQ